MSEVDSDEDLTKELQPLAYHVSDRKRVLKEALKSLKGKRLEAMIPPVLKVRLNWFISGSVICWDSLLPGKDLIADFYVCAELESTETGKCLP